MKDIRTHKEKFLAIRTYQNELKVVPKQTMFGDDNHEAIRVSIDLLKGLRTFDDVYSEEDEDGEPNTHLHGVASDIENWLSGDVELVDIIWNSESIVSDMPEPKSESVVVCAKMCKDCPYSKNSLSGFLADYSVDDFIAFQRDEVSFPCHKVTPEDTDTIDVHHEIMAGRSYFCRGYVESVIKSGKLPHTNELLKMAIEKVKESGLSEDSMSIIDFVKYHNK
jgi:hypothetical protein